MPPLRRYLGNPHWYQFFGVFICELVMLVGAACVIDRMIMILDGHPLRCPKCGSTMKNAGGGFSDSLIPSIFDLAVGAFFVVLHIAAVFVFKWMVAHGSPV